MFNFVKRAFRGFYIFLCICIIMALSLGVCVCVFDQKYLIVIDDVT